ncbi:hypothetical protein N9V65_00665 [Flavobacteriales bacterium]|nr:hypothetical protein [Flavobacteriales bacterium]
MADTLFKSTSEYERMIAKSKKAPTFVDALSFAPPIIQSCSTISSFDGPLAL